MTLRGDTKGSGETANSADPANAAESADRSSERWIALDFETANREPSSACALGLAVVEGVEVVETRAWLIDPVADFDWMNTRIHGIDADDVAGERTFDEVWDEVAPLLAGARMIAHNAGFDANVLRACARRYHVGLPAIEYLCTVTLARRAMPYLYNHKLDTVCDACGIELVHHDAGSDAEGCARVAIACCHATGTPTIGDLASALEVSIKRL